MQLSQHQPECPEPSIGIEQAKLIAFGTFDSLQPNPPSKTIVSVSIKLISIEHVAARGDDVSRNFDVELTVTDNGQNKKGKFGPTGVTIPNGSTLSVNEFLPVMNYPSLAAARLKFIFGAETDFLSSVFVGETVGDDALSPGVNTFLAPVVLETSNQKSTLIFRGRVDVTVLNGVNI